MMPHLVLLNNFWPALEKALRFDLKLNLLMFPCL